ncbi:MAG TPA: SGNH/GDSL hydrolase family protein [Planctomycetota bacterium]|nr:SGNH/GDSL hydrolase family protein [Planctomycetota bacterium]
MIKRLVLLVAASLCLVLHSEEAIKPVLKEGQRVAVVGDSITEQKQYSKFIELYLTGCLPQLNLHVIQLGWGGETAAGFARRMENDLMPYHPNVVTTCYGMNDGGYRKFDDGIGKNYETPMRDILTRLKKAEAVVVVGGPGAVDSRFFRFNKDEPVTAMSVTYNDNLKHLDEIAKKLAVEFGFNHANVHDLMAEAQIEAKKKFGPDYDVCGHDGVHPGPNGHLLMAYAFLKAMGIDGQIGTITVDMKGSAQATDGHKVLSSADGKTELESTRYAFCFSGDEKSAGGTRSILPFVPFNQDLNRFVLIVKNLDGDKAKVTWGSESQSFSKTELEKGVNLTEHFFNNPFMPAFNNLERAVAVKQNYETGMIKQSINPMMQIPVSINNFLDKDAEALAALETIKKKYWEKYERMHQNVRAALQPVKHTISVAVEK